MTKKLDQSILALRGDSPKKSNILYGALGVILAGKKTIDVASRPGFVYVRLNYSINNLVQAFNTAVSPAYDLSVSVEYVNGQYRVLGRDVRRYASMSGNGSAFLPKHGPTHGFAGRNTSVGGGDPIWVYQEQFMPLLLVVSGTDGSPCLLIGSHVYNWFGSWKYGGNTGTPSFTSYLPAGGNAKMLLLYIEGASGNPKWVEGSEFSPSISGSGDVLPYLPTISPTTGIPIAGVRLLSGTTSVGWGDVYDVRQFFGREMSPSGTSEGPGGGGIGFVAQDEGTYLVTGTSINFVGDGVSASASGTNVRVSIPGSSTTLNPQLSSDHAISGLQAPMPAKVALTFGQLCYLSSDGKMALADSDAIATCGGWGLVGEPTLAQNATGTFLLHGFAKHNDWNWMVGGLVYAWVSGSMSQTAPTGTNDVIQVVGVAYAATILYFNPQLVQVEHA